ncbi:hypothetical protein ONS95_007946 [Cadophora gregata]|uniref:uncharacterized protein n=1 Tax=Cadophora gregata TaxID=51156 RepID=UPI0026DCE088|nr:uncharacterized protein ONS95_007946 [Cadophora gregata]KAK0119083.1 hypothetical protein ONS96_012150 [Cadophora gregata f. sp. sojae]KAK0126337.1 hypothetical protein ONS95_007946 [Cadophora gregata]
MLCSSGINSKWRAKGPTAVVIRETSINSEAIGKQGNAKMYIALLGHLPTIVSAAASQRGSNIGHLQKRSASCSILAVAASSVSSMIDLRYANTQRNARTNYSSPLTRLQSASVYLLALQRLDAHLKPVILRRRVRGCVGGNE